MAWYCGMWGWDEGRVQDVGKGVCLWFLSANLQKVLKLSSLLNGQETVVVPLQKVVVDLLVVGNADGVAVGVHSLPHKEGPILQAKSPKQCLTFLSAQVAMEPGLRLV